MSWELFFDREGMSDKLIIQKELRSDLINPKGRMFYFRDHGTMVPHRQNRQMSAGKEIGLRHDIARMVGLRNTYVEEKHRALTSQLEISFEKKRSGQVDIDVGYYIALNFERGNVQV